MEAQYIAAQAVFQRKFARTRAASPERTGRLDGAPRGQGGTQAAAQGGAVGQRGWQPVVTAAQKKVPGSVGFSKVVG